KFAQAAQTVRYCSAKDAKRKSEYFLQSAKAQSVNVVHFARRDQIFLPPSHSLGMTGLRKSVRR
ncbi:MAG: hypothetical protein ACXW6T_08290, partial [Candidatus Binatia bacterium]